MRSAEPPDRDKGLFTEQEFAVWVPVIEPKLGPFWLHPYMVVDNPYAMALGRELYGFPEEHRDIPNP